VSKRDPEARYEIDGYVAGTTYEVANSWWQDGTVARQ